MVCISNTDTDTAHSIDKAHLFIYLSLVCHIIVYGVFLKEIFVLCVCVCVCFLFAHLKNVHSLSSRCVEAYESQFTRNSNQAALCWSTQQISVMQNSKLCGFLLK